MLGKKKIAGIIFFWVDYISVKKIIENSNFVGPGAQNIGR